MEGNFFTERHGRTALEAGLQPLIAAAIGVWWGYTSGDRMIFAVFCAVIGLSLIISMRIRLRTTLLVTISQDALRLVNYVGGDSSGELGKETRRSQTIAINDIKSVRRCSAPESLKTRPRSRLLNEPEITKTWFDGVRVDFDDRVGALIFKSWIRIPVDDIGSLEAAMRRAGYKGEFLP